ENVLRVFPVTGVQTCALPICLTFAVTETDYGNLAVAAERLMARMSQNPNLSSVRLAYDTTQPQLSIDIDRRRAADLGVPIAGIASRKRVVQGQRACSVS